MRAPCYNFDNASSCELIVRIGVTKVCKLLFLLFADNVAQFDTMQAYDVADMFKQYLRELPECLVTNKLSETFLAIYQHVPQELRLEATQACALLLPGK